MWVDIIQSTEGWNRTKGRGRRDSLLFPCPTVCRGTFYLIFSCPWAGIYTISPPISWILGLKLVYATGFPVSPSCTRWIVGLLSFHNHVNPFLMINLSFIHLSMYSIRSVFLETLNNTICV